ncbi:hypothetical protein AK830_g3181 [Neonectria ditissima]|uniref:N-acetyltransferase domain-containing protein n=1 Tax=Neonectria ditissima TaxID=78410 RepID=A0A0P7B9D4_9HYPO|nr:hypothetical protein AK830_g3181 [Neonectria ditissima]
MGDIAPIELVTVRTTLPTFPLPPNEQRQVIRTERLILRPFNNDDNDAEGLHALRAQPEVMMWSIQGRPDRDVAETRKDLALQVAPNDVEHFNWAICLASTGEMLGIGGNGTWTGEQGWPVVGYMLRKEAWGQGYATEFLNGFLAAWWALPREEVELKVDKTTVRGHGEVKDEFIGAVTRDDNLASQRVLLKAGFEKSTLWEEKDPQGESITMVLQNFIAKDGQVRS